MKTLILLRHAKSDWSSNESDKQRPLNARGQKDAPRIGGWIETHLQSSIALVSTATRTRETFALTKLPTKAHYIEELYLAEPETLLSKAQSLDDKHQSALIIAHNPGIAIFAEELLDETPPDHDFMRYPTCACAIIEFKAMAWQHIEFGRGTLKAFQIPKRL